MHFLPAPITICAQGVHFVCSKISCMDKRDEQALTAAKLYYSSGLSQLEVAEEMGVSRPTVAKLLQHARERNFVSIEVHDPREVSGGLGRSLEDRFSLSSARVVDVPRGGTEELLAELGRGGAALLGELVQDGDLVGVSWGNTMYALARALPHRPHRGVEIVQLKGGLSHNERSANDIETINLFCQAFDAFARTLPLPVIFDNAETKHVVEQDRHIAHVLELGRCTDIAVFTVGAANRDSLPLTMGYLDETEIELIAKRAVGDTCSRFFDASGQIAAPEVDARTVGITLADLQSRPKRLLIAGGLNKAEAILTALKMGLATHLVVDKPTAARILEAG